MALADKLVMSDETAKGLVNGMKVGGFWGRLGVYITLYVPIVLLFDFILIMSSGSNHQSIINIGAIHNQALQNLVAFFFFALPPAIPFILVELGIRSWRRKNGFSVNGNITEEIKQREVNVMVAREEKARAKVGGDSKDLDYWFNMMQKGAITKEEYEKKKMELL